ncbi:MAG: cysteine desulfurase [Reyranella sp.]|uniref:cysteine desulfurase family protein n=1 Tax=Reyranella sp. TaxID=1929291 RepID=UPI001202C99D|nr:cysteine desulfurase family protein [Reyranella sp.]TAJ39933.1 MAG: cysteine desulfurase [Reyranella sp.]
MPAFAYLDHNATSPLRPAVFDVMVEALRAGGNPSSVHRAGRSARARLDTARRQVAALVGARPAEVVFTSGGTEANNSALAGAGRKRLLVSAVEHDSVLKAATGGEILPVDANGIVDLGVLDKSLAASTEPALVSVMFANNETGVLQPIADVVRVAHAAGALVHCDAVQGAGKVPVDLHGLGVDYLSLSAHKFGGPTGVGALVVRSGAPFVSDRVGGGQESNRRAGTENVAGIAGFGAAATEATGGLATTEWRHHLETALLEIAPAARVYGAGVDRLPNTTCISMPGVRAETQVMALDLAGICVSAGAACSSGKVTRSAVLLAMGVESAEAEMALRISFGWSTVSEDIERLIAAWRDLYIRVGRSDIAQARAA